MYESSSWRISIKGRIVDKLLRRSQYRGKAVDDRHVRVCLLVWDRVRGRCRGRGLRLLHHYLYSGAAFFDDDATFYRNTSISCDLSNKNFDMILLECPSAFWCAKTPGVGIFNHMEIFLACSSLYSQCHCSVTDSALYAIAGERSHMMHGALMNTDLHKESSPSPTL